MEYVTDQLIINENITLEDFPLGIPVAEWDMQGYHPQAALGLGPNSSVLHALQSTGNISSRSWSMFWGRTGATRNTQMEGTFIFGGYDRAKTSGDNYTYDLKPPTEECPTGMMVTIIDMILGFSNGTNASLFRDPKPAKFSICLIPDLPYLMTIPYVPYFMNFKSLTDVESFDRSLGINYYTMLYNEGSST